MVNKMRLLICGKGGAGKSAITLLMAREFRKRGPVYILDSDESNRLLSKLLGTETPETIANYLGGRKNLSKEFSKLDNINLSKLPDEYVKMSPDGIGLASVGKIEEFGEGCACPYGLLSKVLLKKMVLLDDETVLVDTEAGVEHLGRGVEEGIDAIIVIVDPTAEGIAIAKLLRDEARRIEKPFHMILNKITPEVEAIMVEKAKAEGLLPSNLVRYDHIIFRSSLEGTMLQAGSAQEEVSRFIKSNF